MVGVIQPGAQAAASLQNVKTVAVLGTVATVNGGQYTKELQALNPNIRVVGQPCPLLVPLVEEGWLNDTITEQVITRYLNELNENPMQSYWDVHIIRF